MALWIHGGGTTAVEEDGVTFQIRILPARKMVQFLGEADAIDPRNEGAIDRYHALIRDGVESWSGEGVEPLSDDTLELLTLNAIQRIVVLIMNANTLTTADQGN